MQLFQNRRRTAHGFPVIVGQAHVQCLAALHCLCQCSHGFLQRCFRIRTVVIENVHIVQPQPLQTLIQTCQQIFPAAPFTIGAFPHVIACLGADDQFVTMSGKYGFQQLAEVPFRSTCRRAVVVCQIKMRDAAVKCGFTKLCHVLQTVGIAKVMPQSHRKQRQFQTASAAPAVFHLGIAFCIRNVCHFLLLLGILVLI